MTDTSEKLSAYLDGELDPSDAAAVEALLASDLAAQAELDALIQADAVAQEQFDAQLSDPIPLALAKQIKATPLTARPSPTSSWPIRNMIAASLVVFCLGGAGGYFVNEQTRPIETTGWLADIADYHEVYASQTRHLVEVGSYQSEHLVRWLGQTVGTEFSIPNLSDFDLVFQGGRLLVANGKPVAQLMYKHEDGTVIALCFQASTGITEGAPAFQERTINGFDFVSWSADGADYVVIGPGGQPNLNAIAAMAALEV